MSLLELEDVVAGYGGSPVLDEVSLEVDENVVGLVGRNGVGKTTTLKSIIGLLEIESGSVRFDGTDITDWSPHQSYDAGLGLIQEDRGIFPDLTVVENLQVPIVERTDDEYIVEELFDFFPRLEERKEANGDYLSGGEQQMLATARALRSKPRLLLMDEPSEGLAPQIVENVAEIVEEIAATGTSVLVVGQNVNFTLDLASYIYVMDNGRVVHEGTTQEMRANREEMEQYLRVGRTGAD